MIANWCSFCTCGQTISFCVSGLVPQLRADGSIQCILWLHLLCIICGGHRERHARSVLGTGFGRPQAMSVLESCLDCALILILPSLSSVKQCLNHY